MCLHLYSASEWAIKSGLLKVCEEMHTDYHYLHYSIYKSTPVCSASGLCCSTQVWPKVIRWRVRQWKGHQHFGVGHVLMNVLATNWALALPIDINFFFLFAMPSKWAVRNRKNAFECSENFLNDHTGSTATGHLLFRSARVTVSSIYSPMLSNALKCYPIIFAVDASDEIVLLIPCGSKFRIF